jgi:hypothetical protein
VGHRLWDERERMYALGRRPRCSQLVSKGTGSEADGQGVTRSLIDITSSESVSVQ